MLVQDDSTRRFKHNTAFICNIVVGGVCLTIIAVTFVIHAWRVWRACRQQKVWLVLCPSCVSGQHNRSRQMLHFLGLLAMCM